MIKIIFLVKSMFKYFPKEVVIIADIELGVCKILNKKYFGGEQ